MINVVDDDVPIEYLQAASSATIVGVDIETSGLHVLKGDRIACVQIHVPEFGTVMVRRLSTFPARLIRLMESCRVTKIFQHAPFDLGFLMHDYTMLNPRMICDTKIAAKILDPNHERFIHPVTHKGSHSLIALVWHYFEDLLDKDTATSNWFSDTLTQRQLEYAAKDVIYLPELLKRLERDIFNKNPLLIHQLVKEYQRIPQLVMSQLKKAA